MDRLNDWAMANKLSLNPSRCQTMQVYFGKKEFPDVLYNISNFHLQQVSRAKLLGVTFQHNLKWDYHINEMIGNVNRNLFMLRKLKMTGLSTAELTTVCMGYVRPVAEYAAPVWHSSITLTQSYIIESIQKRVCRIILGNKYTHYDKVLSTLGLT